MNNQISKLTYLLTFNVNIYAEIDNPKTSGSYIIDHNRQPTIHHKIGDTLEISEEAFMKFIEYVCSVAGIHNTKVIYLNTIIDIEFICCH